MSEITANSKLHKCHICDKSGRTENTLYGKQICSMCFAKFLTRRTLAYCFDWFFYCYGIWAAIFYCTGLIFRYGDLPYSYQVAELFRNIFPVMGILFFVLKDGTRGQSLGKSIFGLQVVDYKSGKPAGFIKSIGRNIVVFVPIAIIFIAKDVLSGSQRGGEGYTSTKVIIRKFKTRMTDRKDHISANLRIA